MSSNRFKKPEFDGAGTNVKRFSKEKEEQNMPFVRAASTVKKKAKVAKKQKAFRLTQDLATELEFICFAASITEQDFGESAISLEVNKMLKNLKDTHGEDGVSSLRNLFEARR